MSDDALSSLNPSFPRHIIEIFFVEYVSIIKLIKDFIKCYLYKSISKATKILKCYIRSRNIFQVIDKRKKQKNDF